MENAVLTSNTSVSESETFVSGVDGKILRDLGGEKQKNAKNNTTTTDTKKAQSPGRKNAKKIPKNTKTRREKFKMRHDKNTQNSAKTPPKFTKTTQKAHQEDHKKTTKKFPKNNLLAPLGGGGEGPRGRESLWSQKMQSTKWDETGPKKIVKK